MQVESRRAVRLDYPIPLRDSAVAAQLRFFLSFRFEMSEERVGEVSASAPKS